MIKHSDNIAYDRKSRPSEWGTPMEVTCEIVAVNYMLLGKVDDYCSQGGPSRKKTLI